MKVISLKTKNFRNLEDTEFIADKDVNVIYGNNAQGKTNLLEAIWLFTGSKSFRGSKDADYTAFGKDNSKISLKFKSGGRTQNATIGFGSEKTVTLNKEKLPSPTGLSSRFSAIIFAPGHLELISDGPVMRRKFLDDILCRLKPKYNAALTDYNKAVQQRSTVLRDAKYHSELFDLLDVFEHQSALTASYIIKTRQDFIDYISPVVEEHYSQISKGKEKISLNYEISKNIVDLSVEGIEKALKNSRQDDMMTGSTSIGPHRDDMGVYINGNSARVFGSQGQQRSCVLALKLGEAHTVKNFINEQPVALLDDVMSELDKSRKKYVLSRLYDWQVFITCCDRSDLRGLETGTAYYMKNGKITPKTR